MTYARTGRSRAIREHLRKHPGSTSAELLLACQLTNDELWNALQKMVSRGVVLGVGQSPRRYQLGRELEYEPCVTEAERAQRRLARIRRGNLTAGERKRAEATRGRALSIRVAKQPDPVYAPTIRAQTVEDFIAQGGQVERLPVNWAAPDARRRVA